MQLVNNIRSFVIEMGGDFTLSVLKHGYHKIKETAILLAIPIDLLFDS